MISVTKLQAIAKLLRQTRYFLSFLAFSCSIYTHLPPPPLSVGCSGFSNGIQSNKQQHWKGEGGFEMSWHFPFAFKGAFLDGNPFLLGECLNNFATACRSVFFAYMIGVHGMPQYHQLDASILTLKDCFYPKTFLRRVKSSVNCFVNPLL